MRHSAYNCNEGCPVEATLEVIGGKWKGVILYHLLERTYRFGELKKVMPTITQHTLTKQLRELEADGVISRTVYPEVPPRVEYELTEFGRTLEDLLLMMRRWGESFKARRADDLTAADVSARPELSDA